MKNTRERMDQKRKDAEGRQAKYDVLTTQEKLTKLNKVAGPNQSQRQRTKLSVALEEAAKDLKKPKK